MGSRDLLLHKCPGMLMWPKMWEALASTVITATWLPDSGFFPSSRHPHIMMLLPCLNISSSSQLHNEWILNCLVWYSSFLVTNSPFLSCLLPLPPSGSHVGLCSLKSIIYWFIHSTTFCWVCCDPGCMLSLCVCDEDTVPALAEISVMPLPHCSFSKGPCPPRFSRWRQWLSFTDYLPWPSNVLQPALPPPSVSHMCLCVHTCMWMYIYACIRVCKCVPVSLIPAANGRGAVTTETLAV